MIYFVIFYLIILIRILFSLFVFFFWISNMNEMNSDVICFLLVLLSVRIPFGWNPYFVRFARLSLNLRAFLILWFYIFLVIFNENECDFFSSSFFFFCISEMFLICWCTAWHDMTWTLLRCSSVCLFRIIIIIIIMG